MLSINNWLKFWNLKVGGKEKRKQIVNYDLFRIVNDRNIGFDISVILKI